MALDFTQFHEALNFTFANNTGNDYMTSLLVFLGVLIGIKIFQSYVIHKLKRLAKKTKNDFDDVLIEFLEETPWTIYFFTPFYVAAKFLNLIEIIQTIIHYMFIIILTLYAIKGLNKIIDYMTHKEIKKRHEKEKGENASLIIVLRNIMKGIIWIMGLLLIFSNFGINVASLIAGLGVGGIAIAFALQRILEDVFSSFSIYFDKPFTEGDFIIIGDDLGVVKKIGLKTTRIEHLQGQELVVSNTELTSTRIHNYKKMSKRRIAFKFGIEYGTPASKLEKIKSITKNIIDKIKIADFNRVHFKSFGNFSLDFEVVYDLDSSDYVVYMDTQELINISLVKAFKKEKIEFAFPTQTIHLKK